MGILSIIIMILGILALPQIICICILLYILINLIIRTPFLIVYFIIKSIYLYKKSGEKNNWFAMFKNYCYSYADNTFNNITGLNDIYINKNRR
jgi:hypothetical protein